MLKYDFNKFLNCGNSNAGNSINIIISIRDHSFSTYAKFSEKLTFLTP